MTTAGWSWLGWVCAGDEFVTLFSYWSSSVEVGVNHSVSASFRAKYGICVSRMPLGFLGRTEARQGYQVCLKAGVDHYV
jgi:hypothetical protein